MSAYLRNKLVAPEVVLCIASTVFLSPLCFKTRMAIANVASELVFSSPKHSAFQIVLGH